MDSVDVIINICNQVLFFEPVESVDTTTLSNTQLAVVLNKNFQKAIEQFYTKSRLQEGVTNISKNYRGDNLDEEVLNFITEKSVATTDKQILLGSPMLPKYVLENPKVGMECTLASAMLFCALKQVGYKNLRTVYLKGHQVLLQELADGCIKLYDPATRSTINGETKGFAAVFNKDEIIEKRDFKEPNGEKGYSFKIKTKRKSESTGLFEERDSQGYSSKSFYAFGPCTLIDLGIALENLDEIKEKYLKGDKLAKDFVNKHPSLKELDYKKFQKEFGFIDRKKLLT